MVLGGACPGMVLPALGTQLENSPIVLAGGLAGALVHNLFLRFVYDPSKYCKAPWPADGTDGWKDFQYADKQLQQSFWKLALALAVCCIGCAAALEIIVPYKTELMDYADINDSL